MALTPITRTDATALIPEDASSEIIKTLPQQSVILGNDKVRFKEMSAKVHRLPIMAFKPTAYWVDPSDTGTIAQTQQKWANKYITAEKLAAIAAIPKDVFNDQDYDLWGEYTPEITEAIGVAVDEAVLFGINAPATFPESIEEGCDRVDHDVKAGTGVDYAEDVNQAFGHVEDDGLMVNGCIGRLGIKKDLRGLRDDNNQPIFSTSLQNDGRVASLFGENLQFSTNGSWDATVADLFVGDWSQICIGIRQDMEFELLREATVGGVNLAETDQLGLKVTFRMGWQLANPPTRENSDDDDRYPFAAVRPSGWVGSAGTVS